MWKEYGEYQNLTALLAIAIPAVKPPHELNTELRIAFTKILQGSDVDYPIVASEISVVEPVINSIPEPLPEKVEIPKPEEMVVAKTDTMEETKLERIVEAKAEKMTVFTSNLENVIQKN